MKRRKFIAAGLGLALLPKTLSAATHFDSSVLAETMGRVRSSVSNKKLVTMFENCFPNTLDTTVEQGMFEGHPDTFVITGDIHAMWLRDSAAQVYPYLRLAARDPHLARLLEGVIRRQVRCVLIDPYANAFSKDATTPYDHPEDTTDVKPGVFERKWEIDSLCSVIRLSYGYWKSIGDRAPFDDRWYTAMQLVLRTFREQQRLEGPGPYKFTRRTDFPQESPYEGYGLPTRSVGLIHCGFRPSDDGTIFPFLIPSNYFALISLKQLAELEPRLAADCNALAGDLTDALEKYGHGTLKHVGDVFAYEVDGYGNQLFMDDANAPSLLSLPYYGGVSATDERYVRTREFLLSEYNPWFFKGSAGEGIGSLHTGRGKIWPIAITMRALTSVSDDEIAQCLRTLISTDADTGFMHEAFNVNNPHDFSRKWFAWANSLFGELVLKVLDERPAILSSL